MSIYLRLLYSLFILTFALLVNSAPVIGAPLAPKQNTDLRIHILNVGEGSCAIVELPYNGGSALDPIVFDCGTGATTNAMTPLEVTNYLSAVIGNKSPFVFVSHPDKDHYTYINKDNIPSVKKAFLGGTKADYNDVLQKFREWLTANNSKLEYFPEDGSKYGQFQGLNSGLASIAALSINAGKDLDPNERSNADSLVLWLEYNNFRLVLPGDATSQTLANIFRNIQKSDDWDSLPVNTLIAAHHGSNKNGENGFMWVNTFRPQRVIFSAGANSGNPRCLGLKAYASTLTDFGTAHNVRCSNGISNQWEIINTTKNQFVTQLSGIVVLTVNSLNQQTVNCLDNAGNVKNSC